MKKILLIIMISNITLAQISFQGKDKNIDYVKVKQNYNTNNNYKKKELLKEARKYLGKPYLYGASSNDKEKFDCSSFVQRVYREIGINLPRTSRQQSKITKKVKIENLDIGDLIFFETLGNGVSHVGIYIGNKKFIHASSVYKHVTINKLEGFYLKNALYGEKIMD